MTAEQKRVRRLLQRYHEGVAAKLLFFVMVVDLLSLENYCDLLEELPPEFYLDFRKHAYSLSVHGPGVSIGCGGPPLDPEVILAVRAWIDARIADGPQGQ